MAATRDYTWYDETNRGEITAGDIASGRAKVTMDFYTGDGTLVSTAVTEGDTLDVVAATGELLGVFTLIDQARNALDDLTQSA